MNGRSVNGHVTTVLLSLFRVIVVVAALRQSCSWNEHAVDPFGSWTDRQMYLISEARTQTRKPEQSRAEQSRAERILLPPLIRPPVQVQPFRSASASASLSLQRRERDMAATGLLQLPLLAAPPSRSGQIGAETATRPPHARLQMQDGTRPRRRGHACGEDIIFFI